MKVYALTYCNPENLSGPIGVFSSKPAVDKYLETLPEEFDNDTLCLCEEELDDPQLTGRRWECSKGDAGWTEVTEEE